MKNTDNDLIPVGHTYIRDSVLEKGNVLGVKSSKGAWARDINLPKHAEFIFFAGCGYQMMKYADGMMSAVKAGEKMGMGMDRMIGVNRVLGKIGIDATGIVGKMTAAGKKDPYTKYLTHAVSALKKLGVELGYLGDDEPCCGSPLYYAGFINDYIDNARRNYELFKSQGIKKIIGFIPACTSSLKELYPKFVDGYDLEVKHFIEVIAEKLKDTKIRPKLKEKTIVTYHDPCHLSRYLYLSKEARDVLSMIEGLELREPEEMQRGKLSTCCGGGGGMEVCNPELAERLACKRVEELMATGANVIITSCPACELQLQKGIEKAKADLKVLDLSEIIDQAL